MSSNYQQFNRLSFDSLEPLSISGLRNQFLGERCFIIGNGPSLNKTDLTRLKNEFTFGLNRIYLNYSNMGFEPTFYCCVNPNVIKQFSEEIDSLNSIKFITNRHPELFKNRSKTFFMQSTTEVRFNENLNDLRWHEGWTVTYCAMQVAFHLGFHEVILVGVDHYFKDSGEANKAVTATSADINHFHPEYFGKGIVWQYPDLEHSEESYEVAKTVYARNGRHILDATIGGHLQIYPKVSFDDVTIRRQERQHASSLKSDLKVSIITPSYNQVDYVKRHLESVESQTSQPFEHLIYDPGSTDGTLDIIKAYCQKNSFAQLINEQDDGQVDAINKGFRQAKGDILAWLNSDDYYFSNDVLREVLSIFETNSDVDVVYGRGVWVDEEGRNLRDVFIQTDAQNLAFDLQHSVGILQPSLFLRRNIIDTVGLLDSQYSFAFDYEFWIRLAQAGKRFYFADSYFSRATLHSESKTCAGRGKQYEETLAVVKSYYKYVPIQWINRYSQYISEGVHGILPDSTRSATPEVKLEEVDRNTTVCQLLKEWNSDQAALNEVLTHRALKPQQETLQALVHHKVLKADQVIITSFDSNYFNQGLNLIAGIHRTSYESVDRIFVYNLGLSQFEQEYLHKIEKVVVLDYPEVVQSFFDGYLHPKNYSYKCAAIADAATLVTPGKLVLWIDAGVVPLKNIQEIFNVIQEEEIFFIDHDDTKPWPFFNLNFTHPEALERMEATVEEALGLHLCSAMVGYKKGGRFQPLIDDAYQLSQDPKIVCWPKHLEVVEPVKSSNDSVRHRQELISQEQQSLGRLDLQKLCREFTYLGHRQDQSIYSVLAARYQCKLQSARHFCRSSPESSWASKKNWESGGESLELRKTADALAGMDRTTLTFHHRGIFDCTSGIHMSSLDSVKLFVFCSTTVLHDQAIRHHVSDFHSIGKDRDYQYWNEVSWYPSYYICVDEDFTASYCNEIERLVQDQPQNQIKTFFLRKKFIDLYPQYKDHPSIFIIEDHCHQFPTINDFSDVPEVFAIFCGLIFGFKQIYFLGLEPDKQEMLAHQWKGIATKLTYWDVTIKICNLNPKLKDVPCIELRDAITEPWTSDHSVMDILNEKLDLVGGYERKQQAHYDETELVCRLLSHLPKNSVMVDVGAHRGTALKPFAEKGWSIWAYEPDPNNRLILNQQVASFATVNVDSRAVSDRPDEILPFFTSEESSGISGLSAFRDSHQETCQVVTTTVEKICEEHHLTHINFLKIDTEGFDLMVLKGVPWSQVQPDVIECEFEDRKTVPLGYNFDDIAQYLVDKGYTVLVSEWHPVVRYGIKHQWFRLTSYPCKLANPEAWGNLLAFKEPPDLDHIAEIALQLITIESSVTNHTVAAKAPSHAGLDSSLMNGNGVTEVSIIQDEYPHSTEDMNALPRTANNGSHSSNYPTNDRVSSEVKPPLVMNSPATVNQISLDPDTTAGSAPSGVALLRRIARYYKRWPLAVAILAVALNSSAVIEEIPYSWAFTGAGTALMLFLIGHAASKADYSLNVAVDAQNTANIAEDGLSKVKKRVNTVWDKSKQAIQLTKEQSGTLDQAKSQASSSLKISTQVAAQIREITSTFDKTKKQAEIAVVQVQQLTGIARAVEQKVSQVAQAASQASQTAKEALQSSQETSQYLFSLETDIDQRLQRSNSSNANLFQPFNRQLTSDHIATFENFWIPTLNLDLNARALGYLAHRICLSENVCSGRLATSVEDMLLRILVARSVAGQSLSILEIGSLFGINLGILYETCRDYFKAVHLNAIDPLDGYYGESKFDLITNVPVSRSVFEHNMRSMDIPAEDVTLIQGLSTDSKVLESAGCKQYNLFVIDGDHSYEGVKFDFEHYLAAIDVGGYIIFDDYSTDHWPDIAKFVDQEVKTNTCVEFVGSSWRTAVFKVVRKNLK
ncbi:MAG: hypothetical protein Kow00121_22310 [Elainellaceae cyanobacterium]